MRAATGPHDGLTSSPGATCTTSLSSPQGQQAVHQSLSTRHSPCPGAMAAAPCHLLLTATAGATARCAGRDAWGWLVRGCRAGIAKDACMSVWPR